METPARKYIGVDKPVVAYPVEPTDWPGKLYPYWQLEIEDGDHIRADEQGYDELHEQNEKN